MVKEKMLVFVMLLSSTLCTFRLISLAQPHFMSEKNKVGVKCKRPYHLPSPSLADKKLRKLN